MNTEMLETLRLRVGEILTKEFTRRGEDWVEVLGRLEVDPVEGRYLMGLPWLKVEGEEAPDAYPMQLLVRVSEYLGLVFNFNLSVRPSVSYTHVRPPTYRVRLTGMARMEQYQTIEASSEEEAIAKAREYYGSFVWAYEGMDDDTVEIEVVEVPRV